MQYLTWQTKLAMGLVVLLLTGGGCTWVLISIRLLPLRVRRRLFMRQLFMLQLLDLIGALGFVVRVGVEGGTSVMRVRWAPWAERTICEASVFLIDFGTVTSALIQVNLALGFAACAKPYLPALRALRHVLPITVALGLLLCVVGRLDGAAVGLASSPEGGLHCQLQDHWWWKASTILLCADSALCLIIYGWMSFHGAGRGNFMGGRVRMQALYRAALYLPMSALSLTPITYVSLIHSYAASAPMMVLALCFLHLGGFGNTLVYAFLSSQLPGVNGCRGTNTDRQPRETSGAAVSFFSSSQVSFGGTTEVSIEADQLLALQTAEASIQAAEAETLFLFDSFRTELGSVGSSSEQRRDTGGLAWPST